ncbi:MAG TPA: PAS domain S-box protein [Phycisphaerae bacterium]|nr:PAS domain S-box protein [Phycisphaerae bacterium]
MPTTCQLAKSRLDAGEELFRSIACSAKDAIVVMDAKGKIVFWNKAAQTIFGYGELDALGHDAHALLAPTRYHAGCAEAIRRFVQTGEGPAIGKTVEVTARRKGGSEFPIELSLSAVRQGDVCFAIAVARDITERKRAEEELRRFRSALDNSADSIFIINQSTMQVLDANDTTCQKLGYSRPELLSLTLQDLQPRLTTHGLQQQLSNMPDSTKGEGALVTTFRRKDGTEFPVEVKLRAGTCDGQSVLVAVARDVSNRPGGEAAARDTEQRLGAIWDVIPAGVFLVDQETRQIADANPAALTMIGTTKEQMIGKVCHGLICPAERGFCPVCDQGHVVEGMEVVLLTSQGRKLPVLKTVVPIVLSGRKYVLESFVDISERKAVEETLARHQETLEDLVKERSEKLLEAQRQVLQGEKLASVGRLAAGIAHEINTPIQYVGDNLHAISDFLGDLQAVIGTYRESIDQAAKTGAAPEQVEKVKAAEQQHDLDFVLTDAPKAVSQALEGVQRVADIVRAMKDFSHIKGGASSSIDINRCLESTLTVARNEYKYYADVRTEFGKLPLIACYPSELNQVFLNLLINAAHAIQDTKQRGVITVTTGADGDWVEVSIADTGAGIPENIRNKVYEPFFTTKGVGKGTGQGLFIARQIVVGKHGGTLSFDSEVGKGTTFRIRIPVKLATPENGEGETGDAQNSNPVC